MKDKVYSWDEEKRKKSEELHDASREVLIACEKYLNKRKNPHSDEGIARKAIVQDLYKQVLKESSRFDDVIENLRLHQEKKNDHPTWNSFLSDIRDDEYDKGNEGAADRLARLFDIDDPEDPRYTPLDLKKVMKRQLLDMLLGQAGKYGESLPAAIEGEDGAFRLRGRQYGGL